MRFLVTRELGRLARWLRLLGYDTAYAQEQEPASGLLIRAMQQERVVLTRDRCWETKRGARVLQIHSDRLKEQLKEVVQASGEPLKEADFFTRCLKCNVALEPVAPEEAASQVPEYVLKTVKAFVRCRVCGSIYWPGTHVSLAKTFLAAIGGVG